MSQRPPYEPWTNRDYYRQPRVEPQEPIVLRLKRPRRRWLRRPIRPRRRLPRISLGCCLAFFLLFAVGLALGMYLLFPLRTNILLLGIDYTVPENAVGRSDTIILATVDPLKPYIGALSIPRDLWVIIPGYGENRINTAHFFAEIDQAGSGPAAAQETVALNFGVRTPYFLRVRFDGFRAVVDALGGVVIELDEPMAGYPPGKYRLKASKALAFVRHRADSDDFFRMQNGQFMVKALFKNILNPFNWPRLPAVARAVYNSVDTNIPAWLWPRLTFAVLRSGPGGIDNRIISREMVTPFTTDQGAAVLLPNWALINPLLEEMFGK